MNSFQPGPSVDATSTVRGFLNTLTQTVQGAKTFLALLTASAGIIINSNLSMGTTAALTLNDGVKYNAGTTTLGFFNANNAIYAGLNLGNGMFQASGVIETLSNQIRSNGNSSLLVTSGAGGAGSDVAQRFGTTLADGSVVADASLANWSTGIGGTEVWYMKLIPKASAFGGVLNIDTKGQTHRGAINILGSGAGDTGIMFGTGASAGGVHVTIGNGPLEFMATNRCQKWNVNSDAFNTGATAIYDFGANDSANMQPKDMVRWTADAAHTGALAAWFRGTNRAFNIDADGNPQLTMNGGTRPTANAANRGKLWYSKSAGGVADTVEICLKSSADTYSWKVIQTG